MDIPRPSQQECVSYLKCYFSGHCDKRFTNHLLPQQLVASTQFVSGSGWVPAVILLLALWYLLLKIGILKWLNKLLLGLTAMPTYIVIEVILIVPDEDG
jgi:hypothetical protein